MSNEEEILVAWERKVKVLGNPAMWLYALIGFGCGAGLVGLLFAALAGPLIGLGFGAGLLAFFGVISFLVMLGIDLMGGLRTCFAVTTSGSWSVAGKGAQGISWGTAAVGAMMGSAATAGAGLLAAAEQSLFIEHADVRTVSFNERRRIIVLRRGLLSKPVALYCSEESYHPAMDALRERCPQATFDAKRIPL